MSLIEKYLGEAEYKGKFKTKDQENKVKKELRSMMRKFSGNRDIGRGLSKDEFLKLVKHLEKSGYMGNLKKFIQNLYKKEYGRLTKIY